MVRVKSGGGDDKGSRLGDATLRLPLYMIKLYVPLYVPVPESI
jgi:hypothetical protein